MTETELLISKAIHVSGEGPLDARVWVIGDKLEQQSVVEKKIFVGSSGTMLRNKLAYAGFQNVRFECLVDIRPPNDEFGFFENTPEAMEYLRKSVTALKERILNAKPNIVILLGAGPLRYLLGYRSVDDWRGHLVWSEEFKTKMITTYHPTICIRQRYIKKKRVNENVTEYPGQYEALFMADITKAERNSHTRELNFPKVDIITQPTFTQVMDELDWLEANAKILSYDIETVGVNLVDCISLAATPTRTISIPFYHVGYREIYPYWKGDQLVQIFSRVKQILESDIPKVAQNSQYDTVFLGRNYNVHVRNIVWDTMVASHNLYCELPKDLGSLIALYTDFPYHKHMMKEDRWTYNALDSSSTLAVMEGQQKEFENYPRGLAHYKNVTNFALRPLVNMQLVGTKVNLALREFSINREHAVMTDIMESFDKIFPVKVSKDTKIFKGHKFNIASPKAKSWLFYDKFNQRKIFNKGKPTTDDNAMDKWAESKTEFISLLAQGISKYQHAKAMHAKMSVALDAGRMHFSFSVTGTITGRLNCRETFWGSGTNGQNLKAGVQRQQLEPDDGEEYCVVDLWAAEAFTTAIEADEENLLKLLAAGYKIHTWLYDNTINRWPEECKVLGFDNAKYAYKYFKQLIHSMNYGSEPTNMARESGLPLPVCEWVYKFYHAAFPRIKVRQIRIIEQLKNSRILTSLLGRSRVFLAPYSEDLKNDAYAWPSQSCIGEITVIAMSKLFYSGLISEFTGMPWTFPSLNTHDGIVIRCKLGHREEIKKIIKDNFNIPLGKDKIVVPVEVGWAKNFNDVEDKEIV